jgi:archaellum component FlaC
MRCCMAESKIMARLEKVEREAYDVKRVLGRITTILIDHSERIDRIGTKVEQLGTKVDNVGDRVSERLDRLIAVTTQERTYSVERLSDIERRLSRLEARFED